MNLTEIARGHLKVEHGIKSVTAYGEAFLRGHGSPDLLLYLNSIDKWDAPNGQEPVTAAEREQLILFLKKEFSKIKMVLEIK